MLLQRLYIAAMEVNGVPRTLRNELLEEVEESVQDPGVVDDMARSQAHWDCKLEEK